jgi:hypothetical protein
MKALIAVCLLSSTLLAQTIPATAAPSTACGNRSWRKRNPQQPRRQKLALKTPESRPTLNSVSPRYEVTASAQSEAAPL